MTLCDYWLPYWTVQFYNDHDFNTGWYPKQGGQDQLTLQEAAERKIKHEYSG